VIIRPKFGGLCPAGFMRDDERDVGRNGSSGAFPFLPEDSEAILWRKLHDVAGQRYGITSCLYCFSHSRHCLSHIDVLRGSVLIHSHPEEYISSFADDSFFRDDIVCSRLIGGEGYSLWSESPSWPKATEVQRRKEEIYRRMGMNVGVSFAIPFFDGKGLAGLGLAASKTSVEEFNTLWREKSAEMQAMAAAFDAVMRPRMIANRFQLTPREREVLQLFAGGMSAKEVGHELAIKTKTVFNTMERSRKAMRAANTMEAVSKAMAFGLL
jgi:DNA-binding CsgD family transcriptional regulator